MCQLGSQKLNETTIKLNEFARKVTEYQHSQKLGVYIGNPKGQHLVSTDRVCEHIRNDVQAEARMDVLSF